MKTTLTLLIALTISLGTLGCKKETPSEITPSSETTTTEATVVADGAFTGTVEVACGSCIYGIKDAAGCPMAAKVNGTELLVENTGISAMKTGLCSASQQATVTGDIKDGKLMATSFELIAKADIKDAAEAAHGHNHDDHTGHNH